MTTTYIVHTGARPSCFSAWPSGHDLRTRTKTPALPVVRARVDDVRRRRSGENEASLGRASTRVYL